MSKTKVCTKCNIEKEFTEFIDRENRCKKCRKEYMKKYRLNNKDKIKKTVKKYQLDNKEKYKEYDKNYRKENREKIEKQRKRHRLKNIDKIKQRVKEYNKRPEVRQQIREYQKYKRDNDPLFRLNDNVRTRLGRFLRQKGYKKTSHTFEMIGCTPKQLKKYLEKQFTIGMNWNNHGSGWHIDHIIPLSSCKSEEDVFKLCHFTNLQPLWAEDNIRKGSKINYKVKY